MNLMECAIDCGRSYQTLLRWIKAKKLPFKKVEAIKKIPFREIYIEPSDWEKFCDDNNIKRKGE